MFDQALPDLAIRGEGGIDIFDRQDQPDHRRSRFLCLGRATEAEDGTLTVEAYTPEAERDPERLRAAARRMLSDGGRALSQPFALTDATTYPRTEGAGDQMRAFLLIDFLRAWTLADLGLSRFEAELDEGAPAMLARPGPLAAQVALAHDFNRIARGCALARLILPALPAPDLCADGHAWALRMLGDLALRGGEARLALHCFEAAIAIGDNPHRRARARAAARMLEDREALLRHQATDGAAA